MISDSTNKANEAKAANGADADNTNSNNSELFGKAFFIASLYGLFLCSGLFEEKIYKGTYISDNDPSVAIKLKHSSIPIMINTFISYIISSIALSFLPKADKSPINTQDKLMLGAYYIASRSSSENSLHFLDFISKIIGKSCKSVSSKYFKLNQIYYLLYNI